MELKPLLKSLSEASGVSGYEDAVRQIVRDVFEAHCDEVREDAMGNLIGVKRGSAAADQPRHRIMLAGHMDEIGLIVTRLDKGFIGFDQVGGFDVRTLPGQRVTVHGREPLHGVIGCRPPHVEDDSGDKKPVPMDALWVDVGLSEDQLAERVAVGDIITLRKECVELGGDQLCGKAFDDRAAVAAIAVCLELLSKTQHVWDVYAVATVQEEVGLRGAFTSTFGVAPDVGIAIDVGFAKQPGVGEADRIEMGKGPALCWGPNCHPALFKALKAAADRHEIPMQVEVATRGTGTDANAIQLTREGVVTALLSIPERNMHTPIETISVKDVERTGRLMGRFIADLDHTFLGTLAWDLDGENGGDA